VRFKHARAMGVGSGWTKIRRGVQRKRTSLLLVQTIAVWVEGRACMNL
jgi:hypothetical protein